MRTRLTKERFAALAMVLALPPVAATAAPTYEDASGTLPASAIFGCNFPDNRACNPSPDGGWSGVALGDFDGDGRDDLGASGRLQFGFHAYVSGPGTWTESSSGFLAGDCHGRSDVAFADVNLDGFLDLGGIGGINGPPVVYLGDGAGTWSRSAFGLDTGSGEGFTFGDFDGDGLLDIGTVSHSAQGAQAWLSDDGEAWIESSAGLPTSDSGHIAAAGDFDCDGRDEFVTTQYFTTGIGIWSLDAGGTWQARATIPWEQPYGVRTGDVNADGILDLVAANAQDRIGGSGNWGSVHVYLGAGDGSTFVESSSGLPVDDILYTDAELGDLDTDGDVDIVVGTWDGRIRIFLNDGSAGWSEAAGTGLPTLNQKIETIAIGDIDGDCLIDIAAAAYSCGLRVYRRTDAPPCALIAAAGRSRCVRTCAPEVTLDASASRTCACPPGEARYRWSRDGVVIRDWDASPIAVDPAASDAAYRVDVACASDLSCAVSDTVRLATGGGPSPAIVPPSASVCPGEIVRLAVAGTWASVTWTTDPAGAPGDGSTDASVDVAPSVTTQYTATVVDAAGCSGLAIATIEVRPDPLPPPVDASLRVRKDGADGLHFSWTDLAGSWGGYEVIALAEVLGPPSPVAMDGPLPVVVGAAPPGVQQVMDPGGIRDGSRLTFSKVRATSPCTFRPGTACNGFPLQLPPCP